MPEVIHTQQGDTADMIAARYYAGDTSMTVPILDANPGLADFGLVLPIGTPVTLPPRRPPTTTRIALWY